MLSRNSPVAFITGAAGFIGSHLTDKLLEKGIQVVGVDDLSSGLRENLTEASKDKNFHFIHQSMENDLDFSLPRLDYAFFILPEDISTESYKPALDNFLKLVEQHKSRIVLVSSIDLYDTHHRENLHNLKLAEEKVAHFSIDKKANVRVVRLAAVYGPRMHFNGQDPVCRLIEASIKDELQKEATPLDFTTRSLFIDDAVDLLIKAVMHGATAKKIYDGVLLYPIKVTEIKQILLDPLWHERKGFAPTELPPWSTPNILKTEKELSWKPRTGIVKALRETLAYFKENPGLIREEKVQVNRVKEQETQKVEIGEPKPEKTERPIFSSPLKAGKSVGKVWRGLKKWTVVCVGVALVLGAFLLPLVSLAFNGWELQNHLQGSIRAESAGDFVKAEGEIKLAGGNVAALQEVWGQFAFLKSVNILKSEVATGDKFLGLLGNVVDGQGNAVAGTEDLVKGMKIISGEKTGEAGQLFSQASYSFDQTGRSLGIVQGVLNDEVFVAKLPSQLKTSENDFRQWVSNYRQMIVKRQQGVGIMAQMIQGDKKKYLVILLDNTSLRPAGGIARAYAEVVFEKGVLKDIKVDEVGNLDRNSTEVVAPPAEVKADLGITNWSLKEFGTNVNVPDSIRMAQLFYQKESGNRVDGVIVLDFDAASRLGEAVGSGSATGLVGKIASVNESERDKLAASALEDVLKKSFYLSDQNWATLGKALLESLDQKHLLLSSFHSTGWDGVMPKQVSDGVGERNEFLALSETNLSTNPNNAFVGRALSLQDSIDPAGWISHKLTVSYSNQDNSGSLLVGTYKYKLKVYLPVGTKLTKASFGEINILKDVKSFSDFGWAGYSLSLVLKPKDTKNLVLEYQDNKSLLFDPSASSGQAQVKYKLAVIKQAGTGSDKFDYQINLPEGIKTPDVLNYATDLSQNRSFKVDLAK